MKKQANSLIVLAIGGGGINAANYIADTAVKKGFNDKINMVVVSEDVEKIRSSLVKNKVLVRDLNDVRKIESQLEPHLKGVKVGVIIATLGGKTGTLLTPQVLKFLHKHRITTLCIVTTPFDFEGKNRMSHALNCIEEIFENQSAVIRLNNESLITEMKDRSLTFAFRSIDKKIAAMVFALNDAAVQNQSSLISILSAGKEIEIGNLVQKYLPSKQNKNKNQSFFSTCAAVWRKLIVPLQKILINKKYERKSETPH
jgi:cell division GTPase FtsZ